MASAENLLFSLPCCENFGPDCPGFCCTDPNSVETASTRGGNSGEKDEMHFESQGPYCLTVTDSMEERMLDMQAYLFRCRQPESVICVVEDAGKVETVVDVGFHPDTAVVELPATSTEERLIAPKGGYGWVVVAATFLIASTLTVSCWLLTQL